MQARRLHDPDEGTSPLPRTRTTRTTPTSQTPRTTRTSATRTSATRANPSTAAAYEPRSAKGVQTRARLVRAAKEIFERDGLLHARISDIAKRAKVSYGAFYHYFDSKEQLFREVAEHQERQLTAPPDQDDGPRTSSAPFDQIREANIRYLQRYQAESRLMGVIEQASRHDAHVNAVRMATQRRFAERSERAIRRWQAEGLADPHVDPAIAANALGAMVARFAELWLTQGYGEFDFDDVAEQLSLLWANALGLQLGSGTRSPNR